MPGAGTTGGFDEEWPGASSRPPWVRRLPCERQSLEKETKGQANLVAAMFRIVYLSSEPLRGLDQWIYNL